MMCASADSGFFGNRFPVNDYPPYGFLHTPTHTGLHPCGILRSVPPLGFGFWTGGLSGYGMNQLRHVNNYVCMALPSVIIGKLLLAETDDFENAGITLTSRYHSSNIMSYDFSFQGIKLSFLWYLIHEDALALKIILHAGSMPNNSQVDLRLLYGMNGSSWWGSDAATIRYDSQELIAKILAYGDIFCLKSDLAPKAGIAAQTEDELRAWQEGREVLDCTSCATRLPDPVSGLMRFEFNLAAETEQSFTTVLTRGVNEKTARMTAEKALQMAAEHLSMKLVEDDGFYKEAPLLQGDWPDSWKRGWVMDFETLRMNLMAPAGIYKYRWDGMQALNPRVVAGETAIDMLTLGYADIDTALEVMEGMFTDAPDVYVPCSREDGSVNMIGEDGNECATAPIWGMPVRAIRILLARSGNLLWIKRLYPRLKEYLLWWKKNRTDHEGWYHCNNSWESGQDGSIRFVTEENQGKGIKEAANAESVRTADLEAAMASAMEDMAFFADLLGEKNDIELWHNEAQTGRKRVESMFVDKCYRDFNAHTGKPIMSNEHYDIMLTMPVALGMTTDEQKVKIQWLFEMFEKRMESNDFGPGYAPYWPPILQTLTEALNRMGDKERTVRTVARFINDAWKRNDARKHQPGPKMPGIPEKYCMRIPGVARENLSSDLSLAGCENYGWGCLGPALLLENLLGLRAEDALGQSFSLNPVLPASFTDGSYAIVNLRHGAYCFDVILKKSGVGVDITLSFLSTPGPTIKVNGIAIEGKKYHGKALVNQKVIVS